MSIPIKIDEIKSILHVLYGPKQLKPTYINYNAQKQFHLF